MSDRVYGIRTKNGEQLVIGPLPMRKKVALYLERQAEFEALGYFSSVENAEKAIDFLTRFAGEAGLKRMP